MLELQTEVY